jgi:DNA-binding response OmpR family regulator
MKKRPVKGVLLAEHNPEDAQMIKDMFKDPGSYALELRYRDCIEGTEKYLAEHPVDVVLLSLELLDAPGHSACHESSGQYRHCGPDNESGAAEEMHSVAQD